MGKDKVVIKSDYLGLSKLKCCSLKKWPYMYPLSHYVPNWDIQNRSKCPRLHVCSYGRCRNKKVEMEGHEVGRVSSFQSLLYSDEVLMGKLWVCAIRCTFEHAN